MVVPTPETPETEPSSGDRNPGADTFGISASDGGVGSDDGKTGVPGADCMPGIPGKENNSLGDGIFEAMPGYAISSASVVAAGEAGGAARAVAPLVGAIGTSGVMPLSSCGAGTPGAVLGTALCTGPGAMFVCAAVGPTEVAGGGATGELGGGTTVCMPAAFGNAGMRGKENKLLTGGNTGAAAGDVPFSPPGKYGVEPGSTGMLPGLWGT